MISKMKIGKVQLKCDYSKRSRINVTARAVLHGFALHTKFLRDKISIVKN